MKLNSKKLAKKLNLYAITDKTWLGDSTLYEDTEKILKGGATFLQLREKNCSDEVFLKEAKELKELGEKYNVPFVLNDNVELVEETGADGVHVGQHDMPAYEVRKIIGEDRILGVSAQTVEEAVKAERDGADYLGVGAVFTTNTKTDADSVSYETLKAICEAVTIPVIAIGGITQENVLKLAGSGIVGVSVISALYAAEDPFKATKELKERTERFKE